MKRLGYENVSLDRVDATIVTMLVANARTTTAELARAVKMSAPSVAERIRRLEEAGVIKGYTTEISADALGLPISVWLRIRPEPGRLKKVVEIVQGIPEITECDRVTGEDCLLARARLASVTEMERIIDLIMPYAMTNTSVIQSSPVERRLPPLPGAARG